MSRKKYKIKEISTVVNGTTPSTRNSKYWDGEHLWITPAELKDGHNWYITNTNRKITQEAIEDKKLKVLPKKTILLTSRAPIGKVALAGREMTTNQGFKNIICNEDIVNPEYLYLWFTLNKEFLNSLGRGATFKEISKGIVENIELNIPGIKEQRYIINIAKKLLDSISKRQQQITALSNLEESIFHYYFIASYNNDEKIKLKELCEINPKKSEVKKLKDDLRVSFIPMDGVSETGEIEYQKSEQLSTLYNRYTYFKENDVLFAKITPCMENGKGTIARNLTNEIGFGSTEFHILRPKWMVNSEWLLYLTKSKKFRKEAEDNMTGSAGQKRVPKKFLENYLVTIPSFNKLQAFQHKVANTTKLKQQLQESLKHYENLYNSLMQKAFKGELFQDEDTNCR